MATTTVVSRESINSWPEGSRKLYLFRKAVEAMQEISDQALMDERGYQWVAGVHGGFGGQPYCHHGDQHFITWHRPYVLDMELKLRARIAAIAGQHEADEWRLPYWDWAAPGVDGLPDAFTVATYDDDGSVRPNPLLARPYQLPYPVTDVSGPTDETWRRPGSVETLRSLREMVASALEEPAFNVFSSAIEQPHNRFHVWVGGFMVSLRSSFDPIFWVHHANVDRQFWLWQQGNGDTTTIPQVVRRYECQPFDFRDIQAQAFFDTRTLGYTYSQARSRIALGEEARSSAIVGDQELSTMKLELGHVPADFAVARINLHGVRHPERTCEVRMFGNRTEPPDETTPTTDDERFLGSVVLLGHGACPGAPGHCDPEISTGADLRPPHHLAPFDVSVNVSRTLDRLRDVSSSNGRLSLAAQVIVLDSEGQPYPASTLTFDNVTLTVS